MARFRVTYLGTEDRPLDPGAHVTLDAYGIREAIGEWGRRFGVTPEDGDLFDVEELDRQVRYRIGKSGVIWPVTA